MISTAHIRRKENGTAIISRRELDALAAGIIREYCPKMLKEPETLNIMGLVGDYIKAPLTTEKILSHGDVLGITKFEEGEDKSIHGTIIIDSSLFHDETKSGRCRFTIGHECAHYLFHGPFYVKNGQNMANCRELPHGRHIRTDYDWTEWQANVFASSLLMPEAAVRILCDRYADVEDDDLKTALMIVCTSGTFDVSEQAAVIRLRELGILNRNSMIPYDEISFVRQFNTGLRMKRKYM